MTIRTKVLFIAAAAILVSSCNGGNTRNSEKKDEMVKAEQSIKALPFPDVQVPSMISSQREIIEYLANSYWKGLTDPSRDYLCDSLYVSGVDKSIVEQKFADWTYILGKAPLNVALKSVEKLYDAALACEKRNSASNVFETFVTLVEKYFYNANSPLRNEEYYLPFVSRYATYDGLIDAERKKYEREARLCALNRIGTKAADFRFSDRYGNIRNLYDIDAEMTLLFFSNPGCAACMEIINFLKEDSTISSLISAGRMKVLNIYIDEDIPAWRSYMPIYPDEWYNGFDPDMVIRNEEIYNVRAIPSLYLLDKQKNVLMKDVPENVLFNYLLAL